MEALVFLLLAVIAVCFVLPLVAIAKATKARRLVEDFETRLRGLEAELQMLRRRAGEPTTERPFEEREETEAAERGPFVLPPISESVRPLSVPPPLPEEVIATAASAPPPPIPPRPPSAEPLAAQPSLPAINWEQFMGAKLFAWIGGLALFLGVAFFVKYSFEHNLIPPEARVAIGFAVGLVLVVGGLALKRKENAVTAQTLCATGTLILYAVTFACRSFYHFAFFGLVPTFLLMTLITAVAFLLAVRLNAIAVAILGTIGTVLMQIGWVTQFFLREQYFLGDKVFVPMAIFLGFELLFCSVMASTKHASKSEGALSAATIGMGGTAILWGFYFLSFRAFGYRPVLLLSYIFLADIGLLAIVFVEEKHANISTATGHA